MDTNLPLHLMFHVYVQMGKPSEWRKNNGSWPQQFWQPSPRTLQSGSRLPRCSKLDPKWVYQTGYHFIITEQKGRVRTPGSTLVVKIMCHIQFIKTQRMFLVASFGQSGTSLEPLPAFAVFSVCIRSSLSKIEPFLQLLINPWSNHRAIVYPRKCPKMT